MRRVWAPCLLLACVVMAPGCLDSGTPAEDGATDGDDLPQALDVVVTNHTFVVGSMGSNTNVAATIYSTGASSVVLAIHGSAGVKENNWGPQPVPGYSLAMRVAENGTDFVAVDLPGYGESPAPLPVESFEDYVLVIDEVAARLRSGEVGEPYAHVTGLGHSMGGALVDEAQALHASFDAIAVTGWGHSGFSDEFNECFGRPTPCPDRVDQFFVTSHMNQSVLDAMMASFEGANIVANMGNIYWGQRPGPDGAAGHQDVLTAQIEVPVLVMLGADDWHWNARDYDREQSYYPEAQSFDLVIIPDAGHFQFHHLNHQDAQAGFIEWLGG